LILTHLKKLTSGHPVRHRSQFQADPSDLLGVNLNGGDDNSSMDSSMGCDLGDPDLRLKHRSRFPEADEFDVTASKRLKYLDNDDLEMRRRVGGFLFFPPYHLDTQTCPSNLPKACLCIHMQTVRLTKIALTLQRLELWVVRSNPAVV
jgi:hypothetical protein